MLWQCSDHPDKEQSTLPAVLASAFQYLQREREGRQESPLGHCPVKRPKQKHSSDREMHTPHRSNKPTHEHRETSAPFPFLHGFSLMQQEHINAQKRDMARVRMLRKGYSLLNHSNAWTTKQLLHCAISHARHENKAGSPCCYNVMYASWEHVRSCNQVWMHLYRRKKNKNLHCY